MGRDFPRVNVRLQAVDEHYNARVLGIRVGTSHSFESPLIVPSQREYQYKSDLPTVKIVGAPLAVIDYPIHKAEVVRVFGDDRFWTSFRRYITSRLSKLIHVPLKIVNVYFEDSAVNELQSTSDEFLKKYRRFYEYVIDSLRGFQELGPIILLVQNVTHILSDQNELYAFVKQKAKVVWGHNFLVAPVVDFKVFRGNARNSDLRSYLLWIRDEFVQNGAPFVFIRQRFPPENYIVSYYTLWDVFSEEDVVLLYVGCRKSVDGISYPHFKYFRFGDLFAPRVYRRPYSGESAPKGLCTSTLEMKDLGDLVANTQFFEQLGAMFPKRDFESFVLPAIRHWREAFGGNMSSSTLDRKKKQEIQEKRRILRAIVGLHSYSFGNGEFSVLSEFVVDHAVKEYLEEKGSRFKSVLRKHEIFPSRRLF